ncbi:hypothetical protein [Embleya sp. NPDC020630]
MKLWLVPVDIGGWQRPLGIRCPPGPARDSRDPIEGYSGFT